MILLRRRRGTVGGLLWLRRLRTVAVLWGHGGVVMGRSMVEAVGERLLLLRLRLLDKDKDKRVGQKGAVLVE